MTACTKDSAVRRYKVRGDQVAGSRVTRCPLYTALCVLPNTVRALKRALVWVSWIIGADWPNKLNTLGITGFVTN